MIIRYGNKRMVVDNPLPSSDLDDALDRALLAGGHFAHIATDLGISVTQVIQHVEKRLASGGWRFEPSAGRLVLNDPQFQVLVRGGYYTDMAKELGIPVRQLKSKLNRQKVHRCAWRLELLGGRLIKRVVQHRSAKKPTPKA